MKNNKLFNVSAIFLVLYVLFTIVYDIVLFSLYGSVGTFVNSALTLVFAVFILIGVFTQKKVFFILYYVLITIGDIISLPISIFTNISMDTKYFVAMTFSALGSIALNMFFLILILAMFKWKESLDTANKMMMTLNNTKETEYNKSTSADKLLEYKELLDIGAITVEEYNMKKNELLN